MPVHTPPNFRNRIGPAIFGAALLLAAIAPVWSTGGQGERTGSSTGASGTTSGAASSFAGSFVYTGPAPRTFNEAPILAARVQAGELPPVQDRLPIPSDVMVVQVVDRIGDYGGTWRRAFTGPSDGQNADRLMMDQILYYDLDGTTVVPNLVKDWDISNNGLVYTLNLRQGLKWSDGTPLTSEDFTWYSQNVIFNTDLNPTREGQIGWSGFAPTEVRAVDDYTVQIVLPERGDGFLNALATYFTGGFTLHGRLADGLVGPTHYLKTVHRDFVSDKAAYDRQVAAAGFQDWAAYFKLKSDPLRTQEVPVVSPWQMTKPITGEIYEWERNPYYWAVDPEGNQLPYVDRISMVLTGDQEVLNLKAAAGEIDFQHRHILFDKVPVFRQNSERSNIETVFWGEHGAQASLLFNISYGEGQAPDGGLGYEVDPEVKKWLQSKDFRTALSYAIDRNKVNEVMFLGTGTPQQPSFAKGHPFYPGDEYAKRHTEFDPDRANRMLDDLGLSARDNDGFRLRTDGRGTLQFELMYIAEYFVDYETLAQLIQEDLNKVGIKTFLRALDVSVINERRNANDIQLTADGSRGARDPLNLAEWHTIGAAYRNWHRGGATFGGGVFAEPTDPAILRLAELATEANQLAYADRGENYIETQRIVIDNMYVVGLVGNTPAFNGVIVKKRNFLNVPPVAPNQSALQNPGIARTAQFFFAGGKNDSE